MKDQRKAQGACPGCTKNDVYLDTNGRCFIWPIHYVKTWGNSTLPCRVGGQHLCDVPARDTSAWSGIKPPLCPHLREEEA